ncbi:MAG TPA: hypothetical protein VMW65_03135 [Chloroflexota bacterium]|nr:hypothetical protein [Chloroflexota bacterium]
MQVELYAEGIDGGEPVRHEMTRVGRLANVPGGYRYQATVPAARPSPDYTARIVPYYDGVKVSSEGG